MVAIYSIDIEDRCLNTMKTLLTVLSLTVGGGLGFNIQTKSVTVLKGMQGSHYGYSSMFNKHTQRLLVGAPKEETNIKGENILSGVVHDCPYRASGSSNCTEGYKFAKYLADPQSSNGEGYGMSMSASDPGTTVVCAPFWKDQTYQLHFMPGRCVVQTPDGQKSDESPYYHTKDTAQQYMGNGQYFHGFASFGFAAHSDGESTFVYGAPGLTIFEGGVYIRNYRSNKSSETVGRKFRDTLYTRTAYGYLGYDVKIGKFYPEYNDISFAAGAPNLFQKGMVKLYRWINEDILHNSQNLDGHQAWSYFGSVLCNVDTDRDGIDELLVGAPFYSEDSNNGLDAGQVYIYKWKTSDEEFVLQATLQGSGTKYGRFGSAIQNVGDLNVDNYPDVVIGAPGEEEGSGCIYIYNGGSRGLVPQYSQRICAKQVPIEQGTSLKGFGATISNSFVPQNHDPYPRVAVSAYATDTVIVFETMVLVKPLTTIEATPNPIDLNKKCDRFSNFDSCVQLTVCHSQKMQRSSNRDLDFFIEFEMDTQRRKGTPPRMKYVDRRTKRDLVDDLGTLNMSLGIDETCDDLWGVIDRNHLTTDRFTPIEIKVTMRIDSSKHSSMILDPTVPHSFTHLVSLPHDCGSDNVCNVDLSVAGSISYSHSQDWPYVVIDHTKEIQVDLKVSNAEEPSYATLVSLELSQPLPYLRFVSNEIKQCKADLPNGVGGSKTMVTCHTYQPLLRDASMDISFTFDTTQVALDRKTIQIIAKAVPIESKYIRESEKNIRDNTKTMTSSVYIIADVNMFGTAAPSEVTIKNAKKLSLTSQEPITTNFTQTTNNFDAVVLNHKYQMKNFGPSRLPRTNLYIAIPAYLPDATQLVSRVSVQLQLGDQPGIYCRDIVKTIDSGIDTDVTSRPSQGTTERYQPSTTEDGDDGGVKTTEWTPSGGVNKRRRRSAVGANDTSSDINLSKLYTLSCDSSPQYCVIFRCKLEQDTPSGSHASLNVSLELDKGNIPIPEGFLSFYFQLKSLVQSPKHILFKPWNTEGREKATTRTATTFHSVPSGGEIDIWIIIGSVIAGLLLILVIAIICWKLGFFKRQKHVEMEQWKRQSVRASKCPPATD